MYVVTVLFMIVLEGKSSVRGEIYLDVLKRRTLTMFVMYASERTGEGPL